MAKLDTDTLKAALVGYQEQQAQIAAKIAELRRRIGGSTAATAGNTTAPARKRTMSAAARKRIAAAQKKRWNAYHAKHGAPRKAVHAKASGKRKRTLSPEGRQRIIDALKKRWAAAKKSAA